MKSQQILCSCVLFCLSAFIFLVVSDWRPVITTSPENTLREGYKKYQASNPGNLDTRSRNKDTVSEQQVPSASQGKNDRSVNISKKEVEVEHLVVECMRATHIGTMPDTNSLLEQAKSNARYLYKEYRKVIPQNSLIGYGSYCWNMPYSMKWTKSEYRGHIGNVSFSGKISDITYSYTLFSYLNKKFLYHGFSGSLACLPKIFLVGFPKCGSSFSYCVINKLLTTSRAYTSPSIKEPHFWVATDAKKRFHMPTKEDVGKYLYYYLPGLQEISDTVKNEVILTDGTANKMFKWPQFSRTEHDLANYCLLPSVLPRLIPGSKFITVMRDPVSMLYSAFW